MVWQCGVSYPTLDEDDRDALSGYLDGGGKLFLTGQDIGWDVHENGAEAIDWYEGYLHADYINDDTNLLTLSGVAGDPITYDLTLQISGGDGADNQEYPSDIDPIDALRLGDPDLRRRPQRRHQGRYRGLPAGLPVFRVRGNRQRRRPCSSDDPLPELAPAERDRRG